MSASGNSCAVVILAAGFGKRMRSSLPKVLHEANGVPLVAHILHRVNEAFPDAEVAVVVGHGAEQVESSLRSRSELQKMKLAFIRQPEPRGTGHAVRCVIDSAWGQALVSARRSFLVLPGDSPLLTAEMLKSLASPLGRGQALRLLTCELERPTGYGRVVRRGRGKLTGPVVKIVEEKDATPAERAIREVAVSMYLFDAVFLKSRLGKLTTRNEQGEYYLTDLVEMAAREKKGVDSLKWPESRDLLGINDQWELAVAARMLNERNLRRHALNGVRFIDPASTFIDAGVELDSGVTIHPGVILSGKTRVGAETVIGPRVVLKDMQVGRDVTLRTGTVAENSVVEDGAKIGPYAHLRPDSVVGPGAKIGNFVELKKARVGAKTSVAHLSYVGDAEVGERVNIGCGFITCNFDGRVIDGQRKHRTIIEDDVFMGSDCQCIAPVKIGRGSYVASGSTITENVESDSLAIARSRQVNKLGYARKLRGE